MQGDTLQRLKGIKIIDTNYQVAWERLLGRYDNRMIRFSTHFEAFIILPTVRSWNAHDSSTLLDRVEESVQALRDREQFKETATCIVHCIARKFNILTREVWSTSREDKADIPKYDDITAFLEQRFQSLEQSQKRNFLQQPAATETKKS